ncbi:MAG: IS21 family transposase [Pseudomonadota bacterium]
MARRFHMREIRKIAELYFGKGWSKRKIAKVLGRSRDSISKVIMRLKCRNLSWPMPEELKDSELDRMLFPKRTKPRKEGVLLPDFDEIEKKIKSERIDLTRAHEEFCEETGSTISYTYFAQKMREHKNKQTISMRQIHHAGEKVFVDYSGTKSLIYPSGWDVGFQVEIFVGCLGASGYIFAEATRSQKIRDWLMSHSRMFEFFGGVPEIIVCDNLKSAVTKPDRNLPTLNLSYSDLGRHYGLEIIPARVAKPKDKAKVEVSVGVVRRYIIMKLRKRRFKTLSELNEAILELVNEVNARPFQKKKGSRLSLFNEVDRPALRKLPNSSYQYRQFHLVRADKSYHVEVEEIAYSVPYQYRGEMMEAIATADTVDIYNDGDFITSHAIPVGTKISTKEEHMPPTHRWIAEWSEDVALEWASEVGSFTYKFVQAMLRELRKTEVKRRAYGKVVSLEKKFGGVRLESACAMAVQVGAKKPSWLEDVLVAGLDEDLSEELVEADFTHTNVRGSSAYY